MPVFQWLIQNYIEILGALTGLIYLYFSVNRIIWLWPFGILTSLFYILVFFDARLFADMSLQVYYFFISIYGWYYWVKGRSGEGKKVDISRLSSGYLMISLVIIGIFSLLTGLLLDRFAEPSLPYWDAFTTVSGVVATWMLARKILENWLFWIVIDLVSAAMYMSKGLYPTAILYLVYSGIAIAGFYNWRKEWRTSKE